MLDFSHPRSTSLRRFGETNLTGSFESDDIRDARESRGERERERERENSEKLSTLHVSLTSPPSASLSVVPFPLLLHLGDLSPPLFRLVTDTPTSRQCRRREGKNRKHLEKSHPTRHRIVPLRFVIGRFGASSKFFPFARCRTHHSAILYCSRIAEI